MIVNVLANKNATSTRHLFPIKVFQRDLHDLGIHVNFHYDLKSPTLKECDILLCVGGSYRELLTTTKKDRQAAIQWLEEISGNVKKFIWFDVDDSSGALRTYVFPYITTYAKAEVLKDLSYYTRDNLLTGALHRDFAASFIQEQEKSTYKGPVTSDDLKKIKTGWNLSFNSWKYYTCNNAILGELLVKNLRSYSVPYTIPNLAYRPIDISYRGSMWEKIPQLTGGESRPAKCLPLIYQRKHLLLVVEKITSVESNFTKKSRILKSHYLHLVLEKYVFAILSVLSTGHY